jgi:2-C-methyl-D-erythritol 4-phosphate cytidylyltransferase
MQMVTVVLGGGVGQRLGAGMPKQLLTLGGTTRPSRNNGAKSTGTL